MADYIVNYSPLKDSIGYSALIALIPIVTLFALLFVTKVIYAGTLALAGCIIVATALYHMPVGMAFLAALNGALYGFWPIVLIISAAIFLYDMCVVTGHFDVLKYSLVSITKDKRCLALVLAYCFSGIIEGGSGFSTPIALAGSMMVGVGFTPKEAAVAALLGNTIAVCNGGVGIPTITLSSVTGLEPKMLAGAIQRLMLPFSLLQPWVIVYSVCCDKGIATGLRRTMAVWPACLLVCLVQTGVAFAMATFNGPSTASIVSFMISLLCLGGLLKFVWHPRETLMTQGMEQEEVGHVEHTSPKAAKVPVDIEMAPVAAATGVAQAGTGSTVGADAAVKDEGEHSAGIDVKSRLHATGMVDRGRDDTKASGHMTRHMSLNIERRHPILGLTQPAAGSKDAESGLSPTGAGTAEAGADHAASAPRAPVPTRPLPARVFVMRRLEITEEAKARLDSSSIGTALFPHSLEYATHFGANRADRSHAAPTPTMQEGGQTSPGFIRRMASNFAAAVPFSGRKRTASGGVDGPRTPPRTSAPVDGAAAVSASSGDPLHASQTAGEPVGPEGAHAGNVLLRGVTPAKALPTHTESHGDAHAKEAAGLAAEVTVHYDALHPPSTQALLLAWFPWVLLCIAVSIWGSPDVKGVTAPKKTGLSVATQLVEIPHLHNEVEKPDPTGQGHGHLVSAIWTVDLLGAAGVCIYLVCLITLLVYRVPPLKAARIYKKSVSRMALSFLTIMILMAFGYVLKFSGQDVTLGLGAAKADKGYPFVGSLIGFLGVALTGSATSTSVIFGSLQVVAAKELGINPVLMAGVNMVGGCIGHIVSTASMVVAGVATGLPGKGIGPVLAGVGMYAISEIILCGIWASLVAWLFPGYMPVADSTA